MLHTLQEIGLFIIISVGSANGDNRLATTVTRAGTFTTLQECAAASQQAWFSSSGDAGKDGGSQIRFACIPVSKVFSWRTAN